MQKEALHRYVFIDKEDFRALGNTSAARLRTGDASRAKCFECKVRLSSRVATFSYAKTLDFGHFVAIWQNAFTRLQAAKRWIFVGYSLPEADFELRHLFKMAQLARRPPAAPQIVVVLSDDEAGVLAGERYKRFFGRALTELNHDGFEQWFGNRRADIH